MIIVLSLVYQVNWLRAKARHTRWVEELKIVQKEMEWTCASFQYLCRMWTLRGDEYEGQLGKKGHYSYALKQAAMWNDWGLKAKLSFSETLSHFNFETPHPVLQPSGADNQDGSTT
jgi:hypothetical protein